MLRRLKKNWNRLKTLSVFWPGLFLVVGVCLLLFFDAKAFTWTTNSINDSYSVGYSNNRSISTYVVDSDHQYYAYVNGSWDALRYAYNNNGSWTYASGGDGLLRGSMPAGDVDDRNGTDIALDGSTPVISFSSTTDGVYVARQDTNYNRSADDSGWSFEEVYTGAHVIESNLEIDSIGVPHLAFYNSDDSEIIYAHEDEGINDPDCGTLGDWQCEVVAGTGITGVMPRMILRSSDDMPVVVFADVGNNEVIMAVRNGGGSGTCPDNNEWNCYTVYDSVY
ncbi:MAG TPA: hypothetical protein VKP03_02985, partial [Patescibacteria group bacterium]|nr:hypothetical protein [Patescibacteria group bacterium]